MEAPPQVRLHPESSSPFRPQTFLLPPRNALCEPGPGTASLGVNFFFKTFYLLFIYLFLAVPGLCCCTRAFSTCSDGAGRGGSLVVVRGPLTAVASLAVEHRL